MGGLTADLLYRGIIPIKTPLAWLVLAKHFERMQVTKYLTADSQVSEENKSLLWKMTIPWMGSYQTQEFCKRLAERAANANVKLNVEKQDREDVQKQGPMLVPREYQND